MTTFCKMVVKGKVQYVSFRGRVENFGRGFGLRGQVQNEKNGSVKILCGGEIDVVDDFVQVITKMIINGNGAIEDIVKNAIEEEKLPLDIYYDLPYPFGKVHTDDDEDLGRKLDIANDFLRILPDIRCDTSDIKDILISMNGSMKKMVEK